MLFFIALLLFISIPATIELWGQGSHYTTLALGLSICLGLIFIIKVFTPKKKGNTIKKKEGIDKKNTTVYGASEKVTVQEVALPNFKKNSTSETASPNSHPLHIKNLDLLGKDTIISQEPDTHPKLYQRFGTILDWNLPGFQSLFHSLDLGSASKNEQGPHAPNPFELIYKNLSEESKIQEYKNSNHVSSLFFLENLESLSNPENFLKGMLVSLAEYMKSCNLSVSLRDREGLYHKVLQFSGSLFISEKNRLLEGEEWASLIENIEKGKYVVLESGEEFVFPLPSRFGLLGLLHFCSNEKGNPISPNTLEKIWTQIKFFGETLYQLCIYESLTIEPESTLYNALCFQKELSSALAESIELRQFTPKLYTEAFKQLVLLQIDGPQESKDFLLLGKALRELFPFPARLFRLSKNLFAILLHKRDSDEIHQRAMHLLKGSENKRILTIRLGWAGIEPQITNLQEWFEQARNNMKIMKPL